MDAKIKTGFQTSDNVDAVPHRVSKGWKKWSEKFQPLEKEVNHECTRMNANQILKIPNTLQVVSDCWLEAEKDTAECVSDLIEEGIAAGFPAGRYYADMENVLLFAFTEKRTKKEIDILAAKLEAVL